MCERAQLLRWRDVPPSSEPHKTICNRFICRGGLGVFGRIFLGLANGSGTGDGRVIDAAHLTEYRAAASLPKKGSSPVFRAHQGGLNSKRHTICDGEGRPRCPILTAALSGSCGAPPAGQRINDDTGAAVLPASMALLSDRGSDADGLRGARADRGIEACIPLK